MTSANAAKISGCLIIVGEREVFAIENEKTVATAQIKGYNVGNALKRLVEMVYKMRSVQVMEEQSWKCLICGTVGPLEIDHIKPRARGARDDRKENLRAVCAGPGGCGFHRKRHGG